MTSQKLDSTLMVLTVCTVLIAQAMWLRLVFNRTNHAYEQTVSRVLPLANYYEVMDYVDSLPADSKAYIENDFLPLLINSTLEKSVDFSPEDNFRQIIAEEVNSYSQRCNRTDFDQLDSLVYAMLKELFPAPHYTLRQIDNRDGEARVINSAGIPGMRNCPLSRSVTRSYINRNHTLYYELEVCLCEAIIKQMAWGTLIPTLVLNICGIFSLIILVRARNRKRFLNSVSEIFVGSVVHDMRNPLSAAYSTSEILLMDDELTKDESRKKLLEISRRSLMDLNHQIDRILLIVKNTKKAELFDSQINIPLFSFTSNLLQDYRTWYPDARFAIDIPKKLMVIADAYSLTFVLKNLIENAIKYTGQYAQIYVSAENTGKHQVRVSIEDKGCGIRKKDVRKIFRLGFRSGDNSHIKGSGFGLAVVSNICKQHNWDIQVSSVLGEGTIFSFTLKRATDEEDIDS